MKKVKIFIISIFILVSSLFVLNVCVSFSTNSMQTVNAASIKLSTKKITLKIGDKKKLKLKNAKGKIKWKSSNKSVAKVSSKGVVTARKKGTAKIYATYEGKKYTCRITVKYAPLKSIVIENGNSGMILEGKKFVLSVTTKPDYYENLIKFASSNTNVATVDEFGVVTAKSVGIATIKAYYGSRSATYTLSVYRDVLFTNKNTVCIKKGSSDVFTITASGGVDLRCNISDPSIVSCSWGQQSYTDSEGHASIPLTVTAKSVGYTYITITSSTGKKLILGVEVIPSLIISDSNIYPLIYWNYAEEGAPMYWNKMTIQNVSISGTKVTMTIYADYFSKNRTPCVYYKVLDKDGVVVDTGRKLLYNHETGETFIEYFYIYNTEDPGEYTLEFLDYTYTY